MLMVRRKGDVHDFCEENASMKSRALRAKEPGRSVQSDAERKRTRGWDVVIKLAVTASGIKGALLPASFAYGHTTLNTPDLVRSRKLSRVGPG